MRTAFPTLYRATKPPPYAATLNRGHGLARNLIGYWLFPEAGSTAVNLVTGIPAAPTGLLAAVDTRYGRTQNFDGTNYHETTGELLQPQLPFSVFALCKPTSFSTLQLILSCDSTNRSGATFYIDTNADLLIQYANNTDPSNNNGRRVVYGNAVLTGLAGTWLGLSGSIRGPTDGNVYINGVKQANTLLGTGGAIAYAKPPSLGGAATTVTASPFIGPIICIAFWARNLGDDEHIQMASNPFALLRLAPLRVSAGPSSNTYTKAGHATAGSVGAGVAVRIGPTTYTKAGHAAVGLTAGGADVFHLHFGHAAAGLVGRGVSASVYVERGYARIGGTAAGFLLTSRLSIAPTDVLVLTPETEGSFVLIPESPDSFLLTPIESDEFVLTTP